MPPQSTQRFANGSWDPRRFGTLADPVHQSDLDKIAGEFSCPKQFQLRRLHGEPERQSAPEARIFGTAVHAMIERAMKLYGARSCPDVLEAITDDALGRRFDRELEQAAQGRPIDWSKTTPDKARQDAVAMVRGLLAEVPRYVRTVLGTEVPFVLELEGFVLAGTIDMLYEPRSAPGTVAFCDWKTGQSLPSRFSLRWGYQWLLYAAAVERCTFQLGPMTLRPGQWPSEIHVVHLRDYLPYTKVTTKTVAREEEAELFGVPVGTKVSIAPPGGSKPAKLKKDGTPYKRRSDAVELELERRGPAWYRSTVERSDVGPLVTDLREIVGTIRMRRFFRRKTDVTCKGCDFRGPCLSEGYGPTGVEALALERALRGVSEDGFEEQAAA